MASDKVKGYLVTIIALGLFAAELWYGLVDPVSEGVPDVFSKSEGSFWALAIPTFVGTLMAGGLLGWIGFTMLTTSVPEPIDMGELEKELLEEQASSAAKEAEDTVETTAK